MGGWSGFFSFLHPLFFFRFFHFFSLKQNIYCTDPATRTVDIVPNNWIFLMQLHCAFELGLIKPLPANMTKVFILAFAEEGMSRHSVVEFKNIFTFFLNFF
jgi:hypothetical protein